MRIGADGRLSFVRKYDVDVGNVQQFWSGMVTLGVTASGIKHVPSCSGRRVSHFGSNKIHSG